MVPISTVDPSLRVQTEGCVDNPKPSYVGQSRPINDEYPLTTNIGYPLTTNIGYSLPTNIGYSLHTNESNPKMPQLKKFLKEKFPNHKKKLQTEKTEKNDQEMTNCSPEFGKIPNKYTSERTVSNFQIWTQEIELTLEKKPIRSYSEPHNYIRT